MVAIARRSLSTIARIPVACHVPSLSGDMTLVSSMISRPVPMPNVLRLARKTQDHELDRRRHSPSMFLLVDFLRRPTCQMDSSSLSECLLYAGHLLHGGKLDAGVRYELLWLTPI